MIPKINFTRDLDSWYRKNARDLPWRRTRDPYKIWVSEIMLQQTTVKTVIPYYERWERVFPTIPSVAKAPLRKILKTWQGLGYYQRARNIRQAAQVICASYGGRFPSNAEALKKLPGFGPYTVGAVLSMAFDRPVPVIDANIRRVVMRLLAITGKADPSQDKAIVSFLERVIPEKRAGSFNQAFMELGALVCRSRNPLCLSCPLRRYCRAYRQGTPELIPKPRSRRLSDVDAVIAVIEKNERYFIQQRPASGLLADLWEFPGGKIKKGEPVRAALRREIQEELGVRVTAARHLKDMTHFYTRYRVRLHVWRCAVDPSPRADRTHKWVSLRHLVRYPMPSGSARIVDILSGPRPEGGGGTSMSSGRKN